MYQEMKRRVANRGIPPDSFLDELIDWVLSEPIELFAANALRDVYSTTLPALGPWRSNEHRRAVMVEILRVLAGFESSWRWTVGRDVTNPNVDHPLNEETGPFQVSADSMAFGKSLRAYVVAELGDASPAAFIRGMKERHRFSIGYAARLLRLTVAHNGPVKRLEINPWLSRESVREIERLLQEKAVPATVPHATEKATGPAAQKEEDVSILKDMTDTIRQALVHKQAVLQGVFADALDGGWPTWEAAAVKWAHQAEDKAADEVSKQAHSQQGMIDEIEKKVDWNKVPVQYRDTVRAAIRFCVPYAIEGEVALANWVFDKDWGKPIKKLFDRAAYFLEPIVKRDINNDNVIGPPPAAAPPAGATK